RLKGKGPQFAWSFSPDGKRLGYMESGTNGYDIWTVAINGDAVSGVQAGTPEPFLVTNFDERAPAFSPDGKWLAYTSNESGTTEVYVRAFPDNGSKWLISTGGGNYPRWTRTGKVLIFENLEAQIMAAPYSIKGDSFVSEKQRQWSPKPLVNIVGSVRNYDLAPDGNESRRLRPQTQRMIPAFDLTWPSCSTSSTNSIGLCQQGSDRDAGKTPAAHCYLCSAA